CTISRTTPRSATAGPSHCTALLALSFMSRDQVVHSTQSDDSTESARNCSVHGSGEKQTDEYPRNVDQSRRKHKTAGVSRRIGRYGKLRSMCIAMEDGEGGDNQRRDHLARVPSEG